MRRGEWSGKQSCSVPSSISNTTQHTHTQTKGIEKKRKKKTGQRVSGAKKEKRKELHTTHGKGELAYGEEKQWCDETFRMAPSRPVVVPTAGGCCA